jgi:hypothetical protein
VCLSWVESNLLILISCSAARMLCISIGRGKIHYDPAYKSSLLIDVVELDIFATILLVYKDHRELQTGPAFK